MEPILKWAGGKRQLLEQILKHIDREELKTHRLYEPFVGGGSLSFSLEHANTVINDFNPELVNVYLMIKEHPDELIKRLKVHQEQHARNAHEYYYQIRNLDRQKTAYSQMSSIDKAARIIYLNKTCYNGLYRVNSDGFFNVPLGRCESERDIVTEKKIRALSNLLNKPGFVIRQGDFEDAVNDASSGDIVYFDPPYDYEENGFVKYVVSGFERRELERLKRLCDSLLDKGCHVVISNNATTFVKKLFSSDRYKIETVSAKRYINCKGKRRSTVDEVIIYG